jgi:hypothetical protein
MVIRDLTLPVEKALEVSVDSVVEHEVQLFLVLERRIHLHNVVVVQTSQHLPFIRNLVRLPCLITY